MPRLNLLAAFPALIALTALGCPGVSQVAGTEGETEGTGTSTGSAQSGNTAPATATASNSGASASAGETTASTSDTGPADDTAADDTSADDTAGVTSDSGDSGESGASGDTGADECEACLVEECGRLFETCTEEKACSCWLECLDEGGSPESCFGECGQPSMTLFEIGECVDETCAPACEGGGESDGSGSTGGPPPPDGNYEECQGQGDCDMGLECNMFVGYCSIDCDGDADNCPDPATGNAEPTCSNFSGNCILPCDNGESCPDGMSCENVGAPVPLCVY